MRFHNSFHNDKDISVFLTAKFSLAVNRHHFLIRFMIDAYLKGTAVLPISERIMFREWQASRPARQTLLVSPSAR